MFARIARFAVRRYAEGVMERKDHLSPEDEAAFEAHARELIESLNATDAGKDMNKQSPPAPSSLKEKKVHVLEASGEGSEWKYVGILEGMSRESWGVDSIAFMEHLWEEYGKENIMFKEQGDGKAWVFIR